MSQRVKTLKTNAAIYEGTPQGNIYKAQAEQIQLGAKKLDSLVEQGVNAKNSFAQITGSMNFVKGQLGGNGANLIS